MTGLGPRLWDSPVLDSNSPRVPPHRNESASGTLAGTFPSRSGHLRTSRQRTELDASLRARGKASSLPQTICDAQTDIPRVGSVYAPGELPPSVRATRSRRPEGLKHA